MTKPNPDNKYPKKTQAAAIATKAMADKNHRKFILSAAYIMKNMPSPAVINRAGMAKPHTFPAQPGLCSSRDLTAIEVHAMTMAMIVNAPTNRTDLQYSCQTFLKAIKPYLPVGVVVNSDWANFRTRNCTEPTCIKVADALEEYAKDYFGCIEASLASLYLSTGDRSGAQFIKVLERRFRDHWNASNSSSINLSAAIGGKKSEEEDEEQAVPPAVSFNFEVVTRNDS